MIKSGREIGIRTPGCFHINGFQDRRFRPLSHLPIIQLKSLTQFFLLPKKLRHESFLLFTLRLFSYLRQQLCLNKIQKNKQANNAKKELYTNPFGGDTQIRTGDQGFAIPCLSHLAMSPKTKL